LAAKMQNEECKMLKLLRAAKLFIVAAWKNLMQNMALKTTRQMGDH